MPHKDRHTRIGCQCVCTFWSPSLAGAILRLWAVVQEGLRSTCTHTQRCQAQLWQHLKRKPHQFKIVHIYHWKQIKRGLWALGAVDSQADGSRMQIYQTRSSDALLSLQMNFHIPECWLWPTLINFLTPQSNHRSRPVKRQLHSQAEVVTCYQRTTSRVLLVHREKMSMEQMHRMYVIYMHKDVTVRLPQDSVSAF